MKARALLVIVATTVFALVAAPAPALADQLGAKDDPTISDNLSLVGKKCATQRDKHHGKVVAVINACQRFYSLDSDSESDADRDYGVFWLQSTIAPKAGWCATSAASDMSFSSTLKVVSKSPAAEVHVKRAKRIATRMVVDAGDNATTDGSISQKSTVYPTRMTPILTKGDKRTRLRLQWTGSTNEVLAYVSGAQVSWKTSDGPPKTSRFGLRMYTLKHQETC